MYNTLLEKNDLFIRCTDGSASRRFYVNRSHNSCTGDYGWVTVLESGSLCGYDSNLAYPYFLHFICYQSKIQFKGRRCRDRMVVGFTTTYAISIYHH